MIPRPGRKDVRWRSLRLLLAIGALSVVACDRAAAPAQTPPPEPDDTHIDDAWFQNTSLEDEQIPSESAVEFASLVLASVGRRIYDPHLVAAHAESVRREAYAELAKGPFWTRKQVVSVVNRALSQYGVSHLGVASPLQMRALLGIGEQATTPGNGVSVDVKDGVAVIRIRSFLVPDITLASVDAAFQAALGAKQLLIDLRGNHGGSTSSVVYTAQYVLGGNVPVAIQRTRGGFASAEPFSMRTFFPDSKNEASDADIQLLKARGHLLWITPGDAPTPPNRPTFLLVDRECASSCEVFAQALTDAGAVRVLGQRTQGSVLSAEGVKAPWKGYVVMIPIATVASPKGHTIEGTGIEPDVVLDECARADPGACLAAALARL
jgi:hypothetical protein